MHSDDSARIRMSFYQRSKLRLSAGLSTLFVLATNVAAETSDLTATMIDILPAILIFNIFVGMGVIGSRRRG